MKSLAGTLTHLYSSPRIRRLLQIIIVLAVLLFFWLAFYSQIEAISEYSWDFNLPYLALALAILVARGPLGAHGWWLIMKQLGYILPWWRSLRVVYFSTLTGFIPVSMSHVASRVYLAEREGVPPTVTAVSVGLESLLGLLAAACVAPLTLLAWSDAPVGLWALLVAPMLLLVLRPQDCFRFLNWSLGLIKRKPVEVTLTPRKMLVMLLPYLLNWLLFGIMSWAMLAALYPSLTPSSLSVVSGIFTVSWMAGYLAIFVPQGLVVREGVAIGLLTSLLGVPVAVAGAAALLSRLLSMLGVAVWGAIATRL